LWGAGLLKGLVIGLQIKGRGRGVDFKRWQRRLVEKGLREFKGKFKRIREPERELRTEKVSNGIK